MIICVLEFLGHFLRCTPFYALFFFMNMKYLGLFLFSLSSLFLFSNCEKEDDLFMLEFSPRSVEIPREGGVARVTFMTDKELAFPDFSYGGYGSLDSLYTVAQNYDTVYADWGKAYFDAEHKNVMVVEVSANPKRVERSFFVSVSEYDEQKFKKHDLSRLRSSSIYIDQAGL